MTLKILREKSNYSRIFCMIIMAVSSMALYCVMNGSELYFDSKDYWERGQALWVNGNFSFLNMPDGFRGYVYPLYLGLCGKAGKYGFMVINSLAVSGWFVYCMPSLHICQGHQKSTARKNAECIACFFLFLLLFRGLIIYPLSDLFAIIVCSFSILLEEEMEKTVGIKKMISGFLMGVMLYLAYNVRTIYLFSGIWVSIKLLMHLVKSSQKPVEKISTMTFAGIGIMLASIPQVYMNYHQLGKITLAVPTKGLMLKQVSWGVRWQRYDTFIGKSILHPDPQVYFTDPVGNALMQNMGIKVFENWGEFLKFAVLHPLDLIGIYVRHIVNMMFPCWPDQYVSDLNNSKAIYALTAILVFFLFGTALLNNFMDKKILKRYASLIVPALFILAGAVEVRFFAAVYLLVIGGICFNLDWGGGWKHVLEHKGRTFLSLILFGGVLISMWGSMLASESVTVICL